VPGDGAILGAARKADSPESDGPWDVRALCGGRRDGLKVRMKTLIAACAFPLLSTNSSNLPIRRSTAKPRGMLSYGKVTRIALSVA